MSPIQNKKGDQYSWIKLVELVDMKVSPFRGIYLRSILRGTSFFSKGGHFFQLSSVETSQQKKTATKRLWKTWSFLCFSFSPFFQIFRVETMKKCWAVNSGDRPTFFSLVETLRSSNSHLDIPSTEEETLWLHCKHPKSPLDLRKLIEDLQIPRKTIVLLAS